MISSNLMYRKTMIPVYDTDIFFKWQEDIFNNDNDNDNDNDNESSLF